MGRKKGYVLGVRAYWADPETGKEMRGYNHTEVFGTGRDSPPLLLRLARRIEAHMNVNPKGLLPPTVAKKYAAAVGGLLLAVALLGGCQSTEVEPYRLSVEGMADTGDKVRPLIKTPLTPGEQALVDAWDFQREAGHKLADKEK